MVVGVWWCVGEGVREGGWQSGVAESECEIVRERERRKEKERKRGALMRGEFREAREKRLRRKSYV